MSHHDGSSERNGLKRCTSVLPKNAWRWISTALFSVSLSFPWAATALEMPLGASRDHRGCKGSAGYIWSAVRGSCIRLFEAGLAFAPDPPTAGSSIHLAYVVLADPAGVTVRQAEVFIPGEDRSIALDLIHNQEGDIRPTLLVNRLKKLRIFRAKDDHILEFKGLRYRRSSKPDDPLFQLR